MPGLNQEGQKELLTEDTGKAFYMFYEDSRELLKNIWNKHEGDKAAIYSEIQEQVKYFESHKVTKNNIYKCIAYEQALELITDIIISDFMTSKGYSKTKKYTWKPEELPADQEATATEEL